jgi:integrase
VPLVGEALAILNGVRAGQHDSVFVFPGGRRGKPLMSLYKPMMRLKRLSGIDGFYFHDLRRTARTGWVAIEIDDSLAERLLNHKDRGVQAVYNRHRYDNEKRAALVRWDRRVREIVKGEVLDKVVQLHA